MLAGARPLLVHCGAGQHIIKVPHGSGNLPSHRLVRGRDQHDVPALDVSMADELDDFASVRQQLQVRLRVVTDALTIRTAAVLRPRGGPNRAILKGCFTHLADGFPIVGGRDERSIEIDKQYTPRLRRGHACSAWFAGCRPIGCIAWDRQRVKWMPRNASSSLTATAPQVDETPAVRVSGSADELCPIVAVVSSQSCRHPAVTEVPSFGMLPGIVAVF